MATAQTSLYHRLGGYDALAAAVDELLPRLQGDPQLGVYWKGQNTHTKQRGRQMLLDFLVQALGDPALSLRQDVPLLSESGRAGQQALRRFATQSLKSKR